MSARSKREPKPTSKFLSYISEGSAQKQKTQPKDSLEENQDDIFRRKHMKSEVKVLLERECVSTPNGSVVSNASRRAGRLQKRSGKLTEFLPSKQEESESHNSKANGIQNSSRKSSDSGAVVSNVSVKVPVETETKTSHSKITKRVTVGIMDTLNANLGLRSRMQSQPGNKQINKKVVVGNSKQVVNGKKGSVSINLGKRPLTDESPQLKTPAKQQRLSPNVIRNLAKTKKSEICFVSNSSSSAIKDLNINKPKVFLQNKLRVVSSSSSLKTNGNKASTSLKPTTKTPTVSANQASNVQPRITHRKIMKPSVTVQQKMHQPDTTDIKDTLQKFLVMGSKVADAISDALKHNEESLLSKSSAFEKKCISLVHALASQGSDLEEEDMEKILKLLDEEQDERKLYREAFLESIKVSHLSNMALYTQMLRLLKTF